MKRIPILIILLIFSTFAQPARPALAEDNAARYISTGDPWVQQGKLTASDGGFNDQFGASVNISGDTLVIGARYNDSDKGAAYVFEKPIGGWSDMTETAKLTASDGVAYDDFGYFVAISLDTVVAGAHLDDDNGNSSGSAYVFAAIDLCEGDFEPDGDCDGSDLYVFASDFGRTDCDTGDPCEGDFDGDDDVDGSDLAIFAADFGRTDCP